MNPHDVTCAERAGVGVRVNCFSTGEEEQYQSHASIEWTQSKGLLRGCVGDCLLTGDQVVQAAIQVASDAAICKNRKLPQEESRVAIQNTEWSCFAGRSLQPYFQEKEVRCFCCQYLLANWVQNIRHTTIVDSKNALLESSLFRIFGDNSVGTEMGSNLG